MQVQLKVVGGKQSGQLISINRPKFLIGRADDCQLKSKNELISRYHCVILIEEGYVGVRDLGSRNGVFVNDERVDQETELHNGDLLAIGPLKFEVVISVALSAGKRSKVESIADVVARTVEQNSLSAAAKEEDDVSSWIMEEENADASPVEPTAVIKSSEDTDAPIEESRPDRGAEEENAAGQASAEPAAASENAAVSEKGDASKGVLEGVQSALLTNLVKSLSTEDIIELLARLIKDEKESKDAHSAASAELAKRAEAPAPKPASAPTPAPAKPKQEKKPEPIHLNLDDDDDVGPNPAPKPKQEKKPATSTHKKDASSNAAAENLKNFFQNR